MRKNSNLQKSQLFRLTSKLLAHFVNVRGKSNLTQSFSIFLKAFEYAYNCDQKQISKSSIAYYAIIFSKNLMSEVGENCY